LPHSQNGHCKVEIRAAFRALFRQVKPRVKELLIEKLRNRVTERQMLGSDQRINARLSRVEITH
jgi:hypothetical protein